MANFKERYLAREIEFEEIDDYVDEWNNSDDTRTLAQFLGLNEEEEDVWIEDDRARQNHLRQVLDGGDTEALLATLRSLYRRRMSLSGAGRKLRAADDRLLRDIEKLLLDEFSISFVLQREDLLPLLSGEAELCERA